MLSSPWKKSWRDLWQNKGKSMIVILSIAISTLTIGLVLISYSILAREMNASFLKARPHALSFRIESFDDPLLAEIKQQPGVKAVEARRVISAQIQREGEDWLPLLLYVLRDYNDLVLDIVEPETGAWPPGKGEILLERQALSVLGGGVSGVVKVRTKQGPEAGLKLNGLVYDVVLPQAAMERIVYAYVSSETLTSIGEEMFFNELSVGLSENGNDLASVKQKASDLEAWLNEKGYAVISTDIPIPGQHPHHQITSGMFIIQEIFGGLCCLLCGILVFNLFSAILSGQLPQVGVMKALGAETGQIVKIYFGGVVTLGLTALLLSLPFAILIGKIYVEKLAVMMNFDINNDAASYWTYLIVIGVGLGIPLIAASIPIWQASRISIREAFVEYGIQQTNFGRGLLSRLLNRLPFLSRPMLIALRNTFRKKGRLILTVSVLSVAAALYMSAVNLEATVSTFINDLQQTKAWGLKLHFEKPHNVNELEKFLFEVEGVREVEPFWYTEADIIDDNGEKELSLPLTCMEPQSEMLRHHFLEGSWLSGRGGEIVINQYAGDRMHDGDIGVELKLRIGNISRTYRIVGMVKTPGRATGFINYQEYVALAGQTGLANGLYVNGADHDRDYLWQLKQEVAKRLKGGNFEVAGLLTAWQGFGSLKAHFDIVYVLILVITLMLILVGGNGISLSMQANILERTREIGVIKAIGASKRLLYRILIGEGVFIGFLSWMLAVLLAIPISYLIAGGFGQVLLQSPLPAAFSLTGFVICLFGTVAVSAVACFLPARSTAKLSVREALLYE